MAGVSSLCKRCNFLLFIERAVKRVAFSNGQIATKGRAGFGHANDFHVVLCINGVSDALADCSITVDCHFDDHNLP